MGCRRPEIRPVGSHAWFIIGIPAPGNRIYRGNGCPCQVACDHGKAGGTASAGSNGASAVRNIPVIRLQVMGNLHSVCRIGAACRSDDIIAKDVIHILLIAIDRIMPSRTGAHHIGVSNGVFLGVAAVPCHRPVNITGAVIIPLKRQLDPVQVCRSGTPGFCENVL